jgi:hypothetical protein
MQGSAKCHLTKSSNRPTTLRGFFSHAFGIIARTVAPRRAPLNLALGEKGLQSVKTSRVVGMMLLVSFVLSFVLAYFQLPVYFLVTFLIPALTAAYYQRRCGKRFEKAQRKSISRWYVGLSAVIGIIPLAMLVSATKDQLQEPLSQILLAMVFGIVALALLAYFVVYWVMGIDFTSKQSTSNK